MYAEKFRLDGKIAIITGASAGIGKAIAHGLSEMGARVVIVSRKQESLDRVADEIRRGGGEALPIACHTGKLDQISRLYENVIARFGRVDILVNNAATNPFFGPVLQADEGIWDKTVEVNLKGYFFMSQRAATLMVGQGGGSIINVASVAAFTPPPFQGIYAITKAGVVCMTKSFAKELASSNVRVNAICPGLTDTKFSSVLMNTPEIYEMAMQLIPMKRHAQPSEMVAAVLYLASEASSYVTGAVINIDGGHMT